jgi:poly-gamma-glutamate capsule biosynthesis protein CapA/YwtB (metallophosphatase superfamily)
MNRALPKKFLPLIVVSCLLLSGCTNNTSVAFSKALAARIAPDIAPELLLPEPKPAPTYLSADQIPALTLDEVFGTRSFPSENLDPNKFRTLIATGDVIPARYTDVTIRKKGDDFLYPVAKTKAITSDADLTVINLEAPLIKNCPYHDSGFSFCGRPGFIKALIASGVDVATMENNHIGNHGDAGISETKKHLEKAGISWANRKTPAVKEVNGVTFAFLAFNGVGEKIDRKKLAEQIKKARSQVDVVVVSFHWGDEYTAVPKAGGPAPDDPRAIGKAAIDAGADLIIGNHPHWVQAVELYKGKFIAYAHGNFIFDQMWSRETRTGVIGRYTFYDNVLWDVDFIPVLSENYAQPVPLKDKEAKKVLDGMKAASKKLVK